MSGAACRNMDSRCEELLRKIGEEQGLGRDCAIEWRKVDLARGTNFHGRIFRVSLTSEHKLFTLIVKCSAGNELIRELQRQKDMFRNEVHFYENIAPTLGTQLNLPKYYGSCLSDGEEFIVLQEMAGYELKDIREGLDVEHCKAALREVSRLHSASLELKARHRSLFADLSINLKEPMFTSEKGRKGKEIFEKVVLDTIREAEKCTRNQIDPVYTHRLLGMISTAFRDLEESVQSCRVVEWAVFTHGDIWNNNILFKYDRMGNVEKACLLDWQMCRVGCPMQDFWQLLTCSMVSHKDWPSLANYYVSLVPELPQYVIQDKLSALYGLYMAMIILPIACISNPPIIEDFNSIIENKSSSRGLSIAEREPRLKKRLISIIEGIFEKSPLTLSIK